MKAINPLYLGLLLVVILLMSIFSLNSAKSDLIESKQSYSETLKVVTEIDGLKKAYINKALMQKSLQKILIQKSLKNSNISAKYKKHSVMMQSDKMDKKTLNFLFSKILNSTYNVTSLKIKKLSEDKASFEMEIKW